MSPSAVLSLANELDWQCAGNQNLNTRVHSVMEMSSGYPPAHNACMSVSFTGSHAKVCPANDTDMQTWIISV